MGNWWIMCSLTANAEFVWHGFPTQPRENRGTRHLERRTTQHGIVAIPCFLAGGRGLRGQSRVRHKHIKSSLASLWCANFSRALFSPAPQREPYGFWLLVINQHRHRIFCNACSIIRSIPSLTSVGIDNAFRRNRSVRPVAHRRNRVLHHHQFPAPSPPGNQDPNASSAPAVMTISSRNGNPRLRVTACYRIAQFALPGGKFR